MGISIWTSDEFASKCLGIISRKMPNIKLTYFDLKGRGETTRMLFGIGGVEFEDFRLKDGWQDLKPTTPWGSLPILEVDGVVFGQSKAGHRFAAKLTGMAGNTVVEASIADSLVDGTSDALDAVISIVYGDKEQKETKMAEYKEKTLPAMLEKFQNILNKNKESGFFVGKSMTWADIHFFVTFNMIKEICGGDILDSSADLKALMERIAADEKVKAYMEKTA